MATVRFQIQSENPSAPIYLRLSLTKNNAPKRKTGFVIDSKLWNAKNGFPSVKKDDSHKIITADLKKLEGHVLESYNNDHSKGVVIDGTWLGGVIDKFYNRSGASDLEYLIPYCEYFLQQLPFRSTTGTGDRVGKRTQEKYANIVNKLKNFEASQKIKFRVTDVNVKFRDDFVKFLLQSKEVNSNTAGRYVTVVKTIVRDARKNGIEISNQIEDVKGYSIAPPKVTLSFDELTKINETSFSNAKLETARDWLIISCFTGQRVGDLMRMNPKMIAKRNGLNMISLEQEKTKALVSIPIHKIVREIIEKRNGNFPSVFSSDSGANNAIYNRLLKKVCEEAGIDEITLGNIKDPESGNYGTGQYPKWMLVTSHIGRRSFATNFYADEKYPTPWLMSITGHTTEKMFLSYIGKKQIDHSTLLGEKWKELGLL